jgi:hypothetical protein
MAAAARQAFEDHWREDRVLAAYGAQSGVAWLPGVSADSGRVCGAAISAR